jgi:hypothetical protein
MSKDWNSIDKLNKEPEVKNKLDKRTEINQQTKTQEPQIQQQTK